MTEMRKSLFLCECLDDYSHLPLFQHTGTVMMMTLQLNTWSMILKNTLDTLEETFKTATGKLTGSFKSLHNPDGVTQLHNNSCTCRNTTISQNFNTW